MKEHKDRDSLAQEILFYLSTYDERNNRKVTTKYFFYNINTTYA